MDELMNDLRYAFRSLVNRPALFVIATVSLALGISANTTMFAAIDAFLIRPLPYPDPDRIVQLWTTNQTRGWNRASSSMPDYLDLGAQSRTTELAAWTGGSFNLAGSGGDGDRPDRLNGVRGTPSVFSVLGVRPLIGRVFLPEEEQAGRGRVAVLGYRFWQRRFAGDSRIVGRTLLLDGAPYTVVGVMPAAFKYPDITTDIWTPLTHDGMEKRVNRSLEIIGRIRTSATLGAAERELHSIAASLGRANAEDAGDDVRIETLHHSLYNDQFYQGATISMVSVAFVLLIACANVANLLLARATGRTRELALRTALGAARARLVRQLLTESCVLALAGGVLGAVLSVWGVKAMLSIIPPNFARAEEMTVNGRVLAFTLVISLASGILFGLAPAVQATSASITNALREGGRGGTMGMRHNRLGASLVMSEISLALVLLISAGLLIKGSIKVQHVDLGFDPAHVLTLRVTLPEGRYPDSVKITAFQQELIRRLGAMRGVQAAGATTNLPLNGGSSTPYRIDTDPKPEPGKERIAQFRGVSRGYLEAMRIPLLKGRAFTDQDRIGAPYVVLVSDAFAHRHWPAGDPIGKRITFGQGEGISREIVGVIHDSRDFGPNNDPPATIYIPALQRSYRSLTYAIRSDRAPDGLTAAVRAELGAMDASLPIYNIQTMQEFVDVALQADKIMPRLLGVFGGIALLLAIVGVYGVMSYSVTQRTQEVGIRMALGAQRKDIVRLVVRQGATMAVAGLGFGLLLAAATTRGLSSFLLGVSAFDPVVFAGVTVALGLAALAASYVPARRAVRVDPLVALRYE